MRYREALIFSWIFLCTFCCYSHLHSALLPHNWNMWSWWLPEGYSLLHQCLLILNHLDFLRVSISDLRVVTLVHHKAVLYICTSWVVVCNIGIAILYVLWQIFISVFVCYWNNNCSKVILLGLLLHEFNPMIICACFSRFIFLDQPCCPQCSLPYYHITKTSVCKFYRNWNFHVPTLIESVNPILELVHEASIVFVTYNW